MKRILVLWVSLMSLGILFSIPACKNEIAKSPELINEIGKLSIPLERLAFYASGAEWKATLLSFTQHIPLVVQYTDSGFYISQENNLGIVEGPGRICLRSGENYFYFDVILVNRDKSLIHAIDYRSPKTVNPDSSLNHQKLFLEIDRWRNVVGSKEKSVFFEEEEISLPTKAGTYIAQPGIPLTSYYVQPGSCTSIPVNAEFRNDKSVYHVIAGPLIDRYDNLVADGTVVTFIYDDGVYTNHMEAALLNGFATIEIPSHQAKEYSLFAKVDETISSKISLKPL